MYASQRCVVGGIYAHDLRLTYPVLYTLSYYHCTILHPLLVLQTVRRPKKSDCQGLRFPDLSRVLCNKLNECARFTTNTLWLSKRFFP